MSDPQAVELLEEIASSWPANVLDDEEGLWECRYCNQTIQVSDEVTWEMLKDPDCATRRIEHFEECIYVRIKRFLDQAGPYRSPAEIKYDPEILIVDEMGRSPGPIKHD